jgi:putative transposase
MVQAALRPHHNEVTANVPWTSFDLINLFNAWKKSADAGRAFIVNHPPKPLSIRMRRLRRIHKALARKQKGSSRRRQAALRLGLYHTHIANIRRHFLHEVSSQLVKTHDLMVLENLNVIGMMANHKLARAIGDAGWTEFARQLRYKADWHGGRVSIASRWYPSSQICSHCRAQRLPMPLGERIFRCPCGYVSDRDHNAAVNLAHWAETELHRTPDPQAEGRATDARRREGSDRRAFTRVGVTSSNDAGTNVQGPRVALNSGHPRRVASIKR